MPSLITDTNDFLRRLSDINHLISPLNACRSFLIRHTTDPALINDIPILIDFILTHNLFKFNNDHYLQIKDTAMGSKMAPAYVNISMDAIETSFLCSSPLRHGIYYRYIQHIYNMATWQRLTNTLSRTR